MEEESMICSRICIVVECVERQAVKVEMIG